MLNELRFCKYCDPGILQSGSLKQRSGKKLVSTSEVKTLLMDTPDVLLAEPTNFGRSLTADTSNTTD